MKFKKIKYGSVSITLSIVFIAVIIVVNLIVSALTSKFGLYVDLTKEQLYGITDASRQLLSDIDTEVKIIFTTPLDQLENNELLKMIKTCAEEYEREFDNISIEYIDPIKNPSRVRKYGQNITTQSVIVESPLRFRTYTWNSFFTIAQSTGTYYGFNGEARLTSAIIQVTNETIPKACFTIGHGETVPAAFANLFVDAGFSVETVDLNSQDINPDTKILVISNPTTDFIGIEGEGISETTKISQYLNAGGNVMLFVNPDTQPMQNISDLMYEWGMSVDYGHRIVDVENSLASLGSVAVLAKYTGNELGTSFNSDAATAGLRTVLYNSVPVHLHETDDLSKKTSPILSTNSSAVALIDEQNYKLASDEKSGAFDVMVVSSKSKMVDNKSVYNYFLVCGSSEFAYDYFLSDNSATFANDDMLNRAIYLMSQQRTLVDISTKPFVDSTLTIDTATRNNWLIALVTVLPGVVLLSSLAVFLRRRHM